MWKRNTHIHIYIYRNRRIKKSKAKKQKCEHIIKFIVDHLIYSVTTYPWLNQRIFFALFLIKSSFDSFWCWNFVLLPKIPLLICIHEIYFSLSWVWLFILLIHLHVLHLVWNLITFCLWSPLIISFLVIFSPFMSRIC